MNDPGSRRGSLRVPRVRPNPGTSRASSVRSSGAFDDFRLPSGAPGQPLRARSSRFSLNDQFAATRQEYELWDDDASSIYDRVTNASEAGDADTTTDRILVSSADGFGVVYDFANAGDGRENPARDHYETLCLPRDAVDLSPEQIRRAYYRLFLLFYPDSYPEDLRPIAHQQFLRAQEAFETLIDPARRARYDLGQFIQQESFQDENIASSSSYEASFKEAVRNRLQNGIQTSSDLGIRLDATRTGGGHGNNPWQRGSCRLKLLDFALSQSVSVEIPALRRVLQPQVSRLERKLSTFREKGGDAVDSLSQPTIEASTPTLTVSGSVYGVAGNLSLMPAALLYDLYQPLLPLTIPRHRLIQLVENKLSPLVTLRYRQEFLNRAPRSSNKELHWVKSTIELDADVLPELSATSRLYHQIILPNFTEPAVVEASIQSSRHVPSTPPRFVLGLHQNVFHGTSFLRADSGDWALGAGESCRYFADFSKMNPNMFSSEFPLRTTPSLELGFKTEPIMHTTAPETSSNCERGIRGLDHELNTSKEGSWAVSASATPATVTGFVRYSRDLELPFQIPSRPSTPLMPSIPSSPSPPPTPSSARVEVELCSNAFQDRYLALRNLWSVGRFSRLGLEVGVSMHNLHVSVYWSRLGQRLSVPLLITPQPLSSPSLLFWTGALPFAGLATLQLFLHHRRSTRSGPRSRRRTRRDLSPAATHMAIARNRYEADSVTVLLAQPVEARQKRQMALGGLVILGAKYGVFDQEGELSGEFVADVTIAIAALIDDSSANTGPGLVIPSSVRKSRIPGFWDPAPGKEKTLRVSYSYKGIEGTVEVRGREELILPPAHSPL